MSKELKVENYCKSFTDFIIERINKDKGTAAILRRADNPATEYQSWEQLAAFNVEIDKPYVRLPFATIAAAIAKAKIVKNGTTGLGQALACCYDDRQNSDQAKAKLRRLLACDSIEEVCRILRQLFSLISSKSNQNLDFARILKELLRFHKNRQLVKSGWAQNFYNRANEQEESQ